MTWTVRPFVAADLDALRVQDSQRGFEAWQDRAAYGRTLESARGGFTVREVDARGDGRVIFCGGAIEHHPGYATLWALFGEAKRNGLLFIWQRTRDFIAALPHARIDTTIRPDDDAAMRFARHVGLRSECCMARAGRDGSDLLIFVREDL